MADIRDAVASQNQFALSKEESLAATLPPAKGDSGTAGEGAVVTGTALIDTQTNYGFIPRMAYFDGAGNFGFQTMDGNPHVIAVLANTSFGPVFIKSIYPATYATSALRTTATGVHLF